MYMCIWTDILLQICYTWVKTGVLYLRYPLWVQISVAIYIYMLGKIMQKIWAFSDFLPIKKFFIYLKLYFWPFPSVLAGKLTNKCRQHRFLHLFMWRTGRSLGTINQYLPDYFSGTVLTCFQSKWCSGLGAQQSLQGEADVPSRDFKNCASDLWNNNTQMVQTDLQYAFLMKH